MRDRLERARAWARRHTVAVWAALAALLAVCVGGNQAVVNQQEQPVALATALYGPGGGEANLLVFRDGRVEEQAIDYDADGHARLPSWRGDCGPLPGRACVAPVMGWNPPYVAQVANGSRPLRYCLDEVRAFDQAAGTNVMGYTVQSIRQLWDDLFAVTSVEDCTNPDLILGANAAQDCGSQQAWGCASFSGRTTRVTFNGDLRRSGQMSDRAIQCAIWGHEILHALDLGHTGQYGGEGRSHGHISSLGYVGSNGCPVDNPQGLPPIQDYEDGAGGYRYNLRRPSPSPIPSPSPSPRPSPRPSPTPTPTPSPSSPPLGTITLFSWLQVPGTAGWRLLGEASVPTAPGRIVIVAARGNQWLAQMDIPQNAATSDAVPAVPIAPKE